MRKQILAVMLAAAIAGSMTACAGKGNTNQTEQTTEAKETVSDPLEILQAVWDKFPENDRFEAAGGDMTEENMVDNGPGRFGIENADSMDSTLGFPPSDLEKIDSAASLMHMLNANTFTCGAYHVKNASDVEMVAADLKSQILQRRWMCGFPERLVITSVDNCLVSVFGHDDLITEFQKYLADAYPQAKVISDDPIE